MTEPSISFMDRLRAGLASALAGLAAGFRNLEHWSARSTRSAILGLLGIAVLAFGALAIFSGGHLFGLGGWGHRGHGPRAEYAGAAAKPDGRWERRPEAAQDARRDGGPGAGRPEGPFGGRPEGKPEAPRPPARPAPPSSRPRP